MFFYFFQGGISGSSRSFSGVKSFLISKIMHEPVTQHELGEITCICVVTLVIMGFITIFFMVKICVTLSNHDIFIYINMYVCNYFLIIYNYIYM